MSFIKHVTRLQPSIRATTLPRITQLRNFRRHSSHASFPTRQSEISHTFFPFNAHCPFTFSDFQSDVIGILRAWKIPVVEDEKEDASAEYASGVEGLEWPEDIGKPCAEDFKETASTPAIELVEQDGSVLTMEYITTWPEEVIKPYSEESQETTTSLLWFEMEEQNGAFAAVWHSPAPTVAEMMESAFIIHGETTQDISSSASFRPLSNAGVKGLAFLRQNSEILTTLPNSSSKTSGAGNIRTFHTSSKSLASTVFPTEASPTLIKTLKPQPPPHPLSPDQTSPTVLGLSYPPHHGGLHNLRFLRQSRRIHRNQPPPPIIDGSLRVFYATPCGEILTYGGNFKYYIARGLPGSIKVREIYGKINRDVFANQVCGVHDREDLSDAQAMTGGTFGDFKTYREHMAGQTGDGLLRKSSGNTYKSFKEWREATTRDLEKTLEFEG
ncbi:hypothetical protein B0J14DRAFT_644928 [Halenospora varia]|nr:hypothetical protein B0J14DRAFT_644928 [Halenospora varia]